VWNVRATFTMEDPDWSEWQIRGKYGHLQRSGGERLLALVAPSRAAVARRLGFAEIEEADGEAYVRGSTADLRAFAKLVGFARRRLVSRRTATLLQERTNTARFSRPDVPPVSGSGEVQGANEGLAAENA